MMNPMMNPMLNPLHPVNPISPLNPVNQVMAGHAAVHGHLMGGHHSGGRCGKVQRHAVEIANRLMRKQNKLIYKEIMNYMLKSKFLVGMTEVKLNAALRKKISMLMNQYNGLTEDNVQFVRSSLDDTEDTIIDSSHYDEAKDRLEDYMKEFE